MLAISLGASPSRRTTRIAAIVAILLSILFLVFHQYHGIIGPRIPNIVSEKPAPSTEDDVDIEKPAPAPENNVDVKKLAKVAMVVASQTTDDTTWLNDVFTDWEKNIYVTDDPNAELTVPANKGREGMVYLT